MESEIVLLNQIILGIIIGIPIYSLIVILLFRTNLVYTSRNPDGTIKKKIPISGILTSAFLLFGIILLQVGLNYWSIVLIKESISWWKFFIVDYVIFVILLIYDTFVIDYLIIVKWRPELLNLPETMNLQSMKEHIKGTILIGPIFGIIITLISVVITILFW